MSAISVLITARKPQSSNAQGACSREEPQPKLRPANEDRAASRLGTVEHEVCLRSARRVVPPVGERLLAQPFFVVVVRKRAGMIWSVSMFVNGNTTVRELKVRIGCIV
jgi:hypothetical protein